MGSCRGRVIVLQPTNVCHVLWQIASGWQPRRSNRYPTGSSARHIHVRNKRLLIRGAWRPKLIGLHTSKLDNLAQRAWRSRLIITLRCNIQSRKRTIVIKLCIKLKLNIKTLNTIVRKRSKQIGNGEKQWLKCCISSTIGCDLSNVGCIHTRNQRSQISWHASLACALSTILLSWHIVFNAVIWNTDKTNILSIGLLSFYRRVNKITPYPLNPMNLNLVLRDIGNYEGGIWALIREATLLFCNIRLKSHTTKGPIISLCACKIRFCPTLQGDP